ncbi:PilZ domain-containing protein [Tepidicaulis marinus]|uniref:PilZ domain-containing protein n=1 Tax=Tepidicaulis marinus TaxID=1333998 RepID=UPI0005EFC642|nr:PilZ domain-containing protein [Tepidicaulis marinus]
MPSFPARWFARTKQKAERSVAIVENRRYRRTSFPWLEVQIRGFTATAKDWSAGGVALEAEGLDLRVGTIVKGEAGWAAATKRTPFYADLVRRMPDGQLAFRWLDLDPAFLRELDEAAHAGEPAGRP